LSALTLLKVDDRHEAREANEGRTRSTIRGARF
jgi:hypothetical protein